MLLILHSLLCEVESLEVFAPLAAAAVDKTEQSFLGRVGIAPCITILLYELLYCQVATTHSDDDLVLLDLHEYALLAVLIDALRLSLKAHLISHFIGHLVYEKGKLLIKWIVFYRVIDESVVRHISIISYLNNNVVKPLNLKVSLLQVLKQLNRCLLCLLTFLLHF